MAYTTIDDPTIYFNTVLYTGNGSTQSITGVGFQPDWIWTKGRSGARGHTLVDVIRAATKTLESATNSAEETHSNSITAIGSDGFSLGDRAQGNANTETFVSWNWKAGGSASSNGDGDITSSVSANTTAGFSIVSYTGNGSATQTIGHGLGAVPKMMIFKRRNSSSDWIVYHNKPGATKYLSLNSTGAASAYEPYFANTEPTSSVFTVDTAGDINGSSDTFIAYCFAEKKGYSKFSSYVGNGSSDGPFVHTGFRPAWVMSKRTDSSDGWRMKDAERSSFNPTQHRLLANASDAEVEASSQDTDFLSNGFKIRNSDSGYNTSGATYIYMAFAENPFVNSNGVPNNAR
tara:strand:- start:243 stop:1280 length:1038 start_codon:yes stop_codon:yes gene_type:complete